MLDFDSVLPLIGDCGRYQIFLSFLLCFPFCFYLAFVVFGQVFISLEPDHWCDIPDLVNLNVSDRKKLAIPLEFYDGHERFSQCRQYDVNWTAIILQGNVTYPTNLSFGTKDSKPWPTTSCQRGWEYDLAELYATPVSDWNWVCEDNWKPYLVQSLFFVGCALGCLAFGYMSDRYGRLPTLVLSNLVACLAGLATAFSRGLVTFAIFRFIVGTACDTCFMVYYILVLEYVSPSKRTLVSNLALGLSFALSTSGLPWIAYVIWDWKMFAIITSAPLGAVVLLWFVIPESARWMVANGRIQDAMAIIEKIAKINKANLKPEVLAQIERDLTSKKEEDTTAKGTTVVDLFRSPNLRKRTILLFIVWFCIALCYDGQARNTQNLGFSVFYTFTIASAMELPASLIIIALLDRIGRRWLSFSSLTLGGCLCVSIAAVPADVKLASATLAMGGRLMANVAFNVGLQYAAELLPTVVRGQGVLMAHFVGFIGNIVGPFIVYLANFNQALPLLALGCLSVLAGVLCLFLPETLNQALPQTIEDGEIFGKEQKLLQFPCWTFNGTKAGSARKKNAKEQNTQL